MVIVAASNASQEWKQQADYVCTGVGDQGVIQSALASLGGSVGTVTLSEGTFHMDGDLFLPNNAVLEGQGIDATLLDWSAGLVKCESVQNFTLRNFRTTGTGAMFFYNCSHMTVHDVTATVDDSRWGGAFTLWVANSVMEDIEFVRCHAIDCGRHGWQSDGEGSPKTIRNIRYTDCSAINCGRYSRFSPHGQWTCGFQLAENADVDICTVLRCYAEGNWESGFIFEAAPTKTSITLLDCVSRNNGTKPDDYYNGPDEENYGCLFGAGFWLHGDVTLDNCYAENNRKAGFAVWYPQANTTICNSTDVGSEIGYKLDFTDHVHLGNCASFNAGKYGIFAANGGNVTTLGLIIVQPTGDGAVSNVFGIGGYPLTNSSFDIETYAGGGASVSCPDGQNVQFSGTIRSNEVQPVVVSGSIDISALNVVPYTGGDPEPPHPGEVEERIIITSVVKIEPLEPLAGDTVKVDVAFTNVTGDAGHIVVTSDRPCRILMPDGSDSFDQATFDVPMMTPGESTTWRFWIVPLESGTYRICFRTAEVM